MDFGIEEVGFAAMYRVADGLLSLGQERPASRHR